jgi:hypothetical protein
MDFRLRIPIVSGDILVLCIMMKNSLTNTLSLVINSDFILIEEISFSKSYFLELYDKLDLDRQMISVFGSQLPFL